MGSYSRSGHFPGNQCGRFFCGGYPCRQAAEAVFLTRPVVGVYLVFLHCIGPLFAIRGRRRGITLPRFLFFYIIHLVRVPTRPATASAATATAAAATSVSTTASWITAWFVLRAIPFHMTCEQHSYYFSWTEYVLAYNVPLLPFSSQL